jgi:hypothetical protein
MKKKRSNQLSKIRRLTEENIRLSREATEFKMIAEKLQLESATVTKVLAMVQYLLRVAGQVDAEAKKMLGIKSDGRYGS